jgi:hypothetical protein
MLSLAAGAATSAARAQPAGGSPTLDAIRARGALVCGTSTDLPGFAFLDSQGTFSGLYIDFCKAVAAAVLGDAAKVRYVPTADPQLDVQRLLGRTDDSGAMLGAGRDWAVNIIRQVGNPGEVWNRNVAPVGLPRGRNALYTAGRLQYAPPIR